jgi:hypothetical protein
MIVLKLPGREQVSVLSDSRCMYKPPRLSDVTAEVVVQASEATATYKVSPACVHQSRHAVHGLAGMNPGAVVLVELDRQSSTWHLCEVPKPMDTITTRPDYPWDDQ